MDLLHMQSAAPACSPRRTHGFVRSLIINRSSIATRPRYSVLATRVRYWVGRYSTGLVRRSGEAPRGTRAVAVRAGAAADREATQARPGYSYLTARSCVFAGSVCCVRCAAAPRRLVATCKANCRHLWRASPHGLTTYPTGRAASLTTPRTPASARRTWGRGCSSAGCTGAPASGAAAVRMSAENFRCTRMAHITRL